MLLKRIYFFKQVQNTKKKLLSLTICGILFNNSGNSIFPISNNFDGSGKLLTLQTTDRRFEAIRWKEPVLIKAVFDPLIKEKSPEDAHPFVVDFLDAELISPQGERFRFENNLGAFLDNDSFFHPVQATVKDVYAISELPAGIECPENLIDVVEYYFTVIH